jgi:hypothetical protein
LQATGLARRKQLKRKVSPKPPRLRKKLLRGANSTTRRGCKRFSKNCLRLSRRAPPFSKPLLNRSAKLIKS